WGLDPDFSEANSQHYPGSDFRRISIPVRGGASLDMNSVRPKPYTWIPDVIWLNVVQLSRLSSFKTLVDEVCTKEAEWKTWFESEVPEAASFPCGYDAKLDPFGILLMIRTWCPDRTLSQAKKFISGKSI
ncbi:dynein heavy chain 5, axonemal, partial [Trichonephila inaurata madagascariensis]